MFQHAIDAAPALFSRGTSRPQFLFFGGDEGGDNTLLWAVRAANAPKISDLTKELLEKEHDALENGAQRVEFNDVVSASLSHSLSLSLSLSA